jgi:hypothetical protein
MLVILGDCAVRNRKNTKALAFFKGDPLIERYSAAFGGNQSYWA